MRHLRACVAIAIALTAGTASAQTAAQSGYSAADARRYDVVSASIRPCATAHALAAKRKNDAWPALAQLYADCGRALRARHATPAVLHVNANKLLEQCTAMMIDAMGSRATPAPACARPQ